MILDTNALSALIDGDPAIGEIIEDFESLKLNSISLGEYRFGILQSRYRTEYENQLSQLEADFEVLTVDVTTATFYALVRHELKSLGRPIPYHDIWIAALARQHGLAVVSRDTHFDSVRGIQRLSW
ncbi:MAG: type II toxin-antitoxin system VapC family toxin [Chthoniobacterales bacterium]